MANLRTPDGNVAQFIVSDGEGNESVGHLELTVVPSFVPGTRCSDLSFVIDEQRRSARPPQAPEELIRQARLTS